MTDALIYLAPGFLIQILMAALLLWLFANEKDEVSLGRILLISLGFTGLNVLIEGSIQDYLLYATLVVQWCLFTLIANRFISIRLPRASLTIFCYFMILLGFQMLETRLSPDDLSEDEKLLLQGFEKADEDKDQESEQENWVSNLELNMIGARAMQARYQILDILYPPPEPTELPSDPSPEPSVVISLTPKASNAISGGPNPSGSMTGKEFEARFFSKNEGVEPETPEPAEVVVAVPLPDDTIFITQPEQVREPIRPSGRAMITAEEMSEIVDIRSRSTDPSYAAPEYDVSALSIGKGGKFAIVDGEMLREGSIIRTQLENPRGWRLLRIAANEVFWQPLK